MATPEEKQKLLSELREFAGADKVPEGPGTTPFQKGQFSPRQRRFLAYRLQGYSLTDSAIKAGYECKNRAVARNVGSSIWKKMKGNELVLAAFEEVGITPESAAEKHKELLNCKMVVRVSEGEVVEVPDNTNQNKALQMLYEVSGSYAPKQETLTIQTYERKVELSEQIKDNPQMLDVLKQKLIEIKRTKGADSE